MGERHHALPARPNLAWYRKAAKQLHGAVAEHDPAALERAREVLGERVAERVLLADAQHVIAQEHGYRSWPDFQAIVRSRSEDDRPVDRIGLGDESGYDERARRLQEELGAGRDDALRRVRAYVPRLQSLSDATLTEAGLERRDARLVVAREYGFRTWRELVAGVRELTAAWRAQGGRQLDVDAMSVEALVEAGSDLDGPLRLAICNGRVELMQSLLKHGARLEGTDPVLGLTPLATAVYYRQPEAADLLLAHGAHAGPIWLAAGCGLVARVEGWFAPDGSLRPDAGDPRPNLADVHWPPAPPPRDDVADILGEALCHAAHNGRDAVIEALLARGVSVDARPYLGMTSLHFAVTADRLETARLLLERGCDLTLRDEIHGGTPLEWCLHLGRPRLRALLEQASTS
jgi:hypothetical protein